MSNSKSRAAKAVDKPPPDVPRKPKDKFPAARGTVTADREKSASDDEADLLSRERLVAARENTANVRESASDAREVAVLVREEATHAREGESNTREETATAREDAMHLSKVALQLESTEHIAMLQQANAHLVAATLAAKRQTEQIEKVRVELLHLAHHDVLTDLPNRVLLKDRLSQALEAAHRQGRQLAVMFMDIDRFKHINDSLGHAIGDQLLQSVAKRLLTCVRVSDTVSRQGGDEFVLLLPMIENPEGAALSAKKILTALAQPHHVEGHDLHISFSIGVSIYPDDGEDAETLLKHADTAMFYAKENGRNNYQFFEREMDDRAAERQFIEASLRRALQRNEFVLHYQPKIDLNSGAMVGVEALIRWQHPQRGLLMPAQFVSIAEDCGLILPIGRWVLHEACQQAASWMAAGLPAISVAVNTSALEFRSEEFLDNVSATLKATGLDPHFLEIELTESVLMRDVESTNVVLHALSGMGIRLSIDDFGTGYSSLSYLRRFPINTLKIDQWFVNQLDANPDDATIVQAVISMGKSLHQRVIAEGVETQEQYAFLLAEKCDEAQGYFFGLPLAPQALATLLKAGGSLIPAPTQRGM